MKSLLVLLVFMANFLSGQLLAQEDSYFFVFLNTNPDREVLPDDSVEALQKAHLENIGRLYNEGKLSAAGPFEGGGGIFIFRTSSLEETHELLQTDPAIRAGRFRLEVYPFDQYFGSVCAVGEDYEMKFRMFIRFKRPGTATGSLELTRKLLQDEFEELEETSIVHKIAAANLGSINEGIWILSGESEPVKEFLDGNEKLKKADIVYDMKTLWIADGTFCEE